MTQENRKREFEDAYEQAWHGWGPLHEMCKQDHRNYLVNSYTAEDLTKFKQLGIDALQFPMIRRNIKIVANHQRNNRLQFRFDPVEGSDVQAAQDFTEYIGQEMGRNRGYHVISDSFEGSLKTRISLVNAYNTRHDEIKLRRYSYNSFVLDPGFTQRDLSDCHYGIIRQKITKENAYKLLPGQESSIDRIFNKSKSDDSKFPEMPRETLYGEHLFYYDEWQRKKSIKKKYLITTQNGKQVFVTDPMGKRVEFLGSDSDLKVLLQMYPYMDTTTDWVDSVEVTGYLNGIEVTNEIDPFGLGDFSFTPVIAFFDPDYTDVRYRIHSMVSILRDTERMNGKFMNFIMGCLALNAWSGVDVESDALEFPEQAVQSGPQPRILKPGAIAKGKIRDRPNPDIPPGILHVVEMLPRYMETMSVMNPDMFGISSQNETQIPGVLSKMRQGAGMVGIFDLFDNLSYAQSIIGTKVKNLAQQHQKEKVERVLGRPVSEQFFDKEYSKYDCICVEGTLTDTQRNLFYTELMNWKQLGATMGDPAPIPWSAILENHPSAMNSELKKILQQNEQQQQAEAQRQKQLNDTLQQLAIRKEQATIASEESQNVERLAQAGLNEATERLNQVKTMTEMQDLRDGRALDAAKLAVQLEVARMNSDKRDETKEK